MMNQDPHLPKINTPFSVPEKYFEQSKQNILNKTVRQEKQHTFSFHIKKWGVLATSFCLLLLIGLGLSQTISNNAYDFAFSPEEETLEYAFVTYDMDADLLQQNTDEALDDLILAYLMDEEMDLLTADFE